MIELRKSFFRVGVNTSLSAEHPNIYIGLWSITLIASVDRILNDNTNVYGLRLRFDVVW